MSCNKITHILNEGRPLRRITCYTSISHLATSLSDRNFEEEETCSLCQNCSLATSCQRSMGCGSSRGIPIATVSNMPEASPPGQEADRDQPAVEVKAKGESTTAGLIRVKEMPPGSCDSIPVESQYGSTDSILSSTKSSSSTYGKPRNSSAKSNDSGLGGRGEEGTNDDIITEKSSTVLQEAAKVPEDATNVDLSIDSKQMRTPGPMGHRKRSHWGKLPPVHPKGRPNNSEEDKALETLLQKHVQFADKLIDELPTTSTIVKRPVSRGGVAFDIRTDEEEGSSSTSRGCPRKPACVLKYTQHRRAAEVVTHAELDEKQKAANQRRKVS